MKTTITVEDIKREAQDYIDYSKKRMIAIRKNTKKLTATLDLLNRRIALIDEERASIAVWHDCDAYKGTVGIQAEIRVKSDSLIEGIVPQCLKAMMDIECDPVGSKDSTTSVSANRTYSFERPESEHFVKIVIRVVVDIEESPFGTCKKVQIGTEILEVPKYKIECTEPTQGEAV